MDNGNRSEFTVPFSYKTGGLENDRRPCLASHLNAMPGKREKERSGENCYTITSASKIVTYKPDAQAREDGFPRLRVGLVCELLSCRSNNSSVAGSYFAG